MKTIDRLNGLVSELSGRTGEPAGVAAGGAPAAEVMIRQTAVDFSRLRGVEGRHGR